MQDGWITNNLQRLWFTGNSIADNDIEAVAHASAGDVLSSTMNQAFPEPVNGEFYPWTKIRDALIAVNAIGEAWPASDEPDVTGIDSLSTPGSY